MAIHVRCAVAYRGSNVLAISWTTSTKCNWSVRMYTELQMVDSGNWFADEFVGLFGRFVNTWSC
jgi:hypothetical protein